jgi:hypothetical protein
MHPVGSHQTGEALEGNVTPDPGQRILSFADLDRWFSTSSPGDRVSYFRGFLALDRGPGSRLGEESGLELDRVATAVMAMAAAGHVHLVQRRHGPNDYTYVAVRARGSRRSVRPSMGARS